GASDTARRFVEDYSRNPALDRHRDDLATVLLNIGGQIANRAEQQPADADDLLRRGDQMLALIDRYPPRNGQLADLRKQFDQSRTTPTGAGERRNRDTPTLLPPRNQTPNRPAANGIMREPALKNAPGVLPETEFPQKNPGALVFYEPLNRQPQAVA